MLMQGKPMIRVLKSNPYQNLHEFFDLNGVRPQIFETTANKAIALEGRMGTRFQLPAFAFEDATGQVIRQGTIKLFVKEVFSKAEMVLTGKFSTAEDQMMVSGGMMYIRATQGEQELQLCRTIEVMVPTVYQPPSPLPMRLFGESQATSRSVLLKQAFDWKELSKKNIRIKKKAERSYYYFKTKRLGWLSCNHPLKLNRKLSMLSAKYHCKYGSMDQQIAFLLFENHNTVVRMYPQGQSFTSFNIPVGEPAQMIVLGLKQEQLFWGQLPIGHTLNSVYLVHLDAVDEQTVLNGLAKL